MKKKILIIFGIFAIFLVCFAAKPFIFHSTSSKVQLLASPSVSVTFDTGSTIATVSGIVANNAFQAIVEAAKKQNLELKTKQYDFGVFVEQIGTLANTKEKAWIYSVNGKAGDVASDKYPLKQHDSIEWKYTTPLY